MATPTLPLHIASGEMAKGYSEMGMDEDDHLLKQDNTPEESKSLSYGPRKSIGLAALVPLLTVLFWSFGMGSALLIWLLARRIPPIPGSSPGIFGGFIIVDEGNKTGSTQMLDGQESLESNMRGVLIITAISHFSSMAVVPLMALGAFYVAAQWLDEADPKDGPTPLQFGLIMQMCSSGTWDSVLMTLKYLFRCWKTKVTTHTRVSPIVYRALFSASMVVILHYGVVATDLWLTADIGSVYYSRESEVDIASSPNASILGTQYNTTVSPLEYGEAHYTTVYKQWVFGDDPSYTPDPHDYYYHGLDTIHGLSAKNHISIINLSNSSSLQDTSSMAVIVRPPSNVPSQWSWTASTIGMTVQCQPAPCSPAEGRSLIICPEPSGVYQPMPLPTFPYMVSSYGIRANNATAYNPTTGGAISNVFTWIKPYLPPPQTNPSYAVIQLHLGSSSWDSRRDRSEVGRIRFNGTYVWSSFYVGTCQITFYDVEVRFTGSPDTGSNASNKDISSQYSLASPPVLMSENKTTLLFSPIVSLYNLYADTILNYSVMQLLENNLLADLTSPGFSSRVSAEFARLCLGLISAMTEPVPAKGVVNNSARLVSRYPLAGTLSYIIVVYAHGLLAIVLFVGILGRSSNSVVVNNPGWRVNWRGVPVREKRKPVQELVLVHLRLTDPLAVVAEHFSGPNFDGQERDEKMSDGPLSATFTSAGALSTRKDPIEMFGVENADTIRVQVGLIDDEEGEPRFGLSRRKGHNSLDRLTDIC